MCAVAAGKHIHRKAILRDLSGSGTACLDGQHTWRSNWYQKHCNDRAERIVLGQSSSSTWCLQLRKEEVLQMKSRDANTHHWCSTLRQQCQDRQKYLVSFPQPSTTIPTRFASWAGVFRLAISACCGVQQDI